MPKAQRSQASEAMEGTTAVKQPFDFEKYRINTAPVVKTLTVDDEEFDGHIHQFPSIIVIYKTGEYEFMPSRENFVQYGEQKNYPEEEWELRAKSLSREINPSLTVLLCLRR